MPSIAGLRIGTERGRTQGDNVLLSVFEFLISDIDRALMIIGPNRYWEVLDVVAKTSEHGGTLIGHPGVKALLNANFIRLADVFGTQQVIQELEKRAHIKDVLDIIGRRNLVDLKILFPVLKRGAVRKVRRNIRTVFRSA